MRIQEVWTNEMRPSEFVTFRILLYESLIVRSGPAPQTDRAVRYKTEGTVTWAGILASTASAVNGTYFPG